MAERFPPDVIESDVIDQIKQFRQTVPDSVRIVAVTKSVSAELMRAVYAAGIRDFGENRVQAAAEKQAQLQDLSDITWHMIGHLQSNKVQQALTLFRWIHSVDSLKLAQRLDRLAGEGGYQPQICLQVKILPDPDKSGWKVSELFSDLPQLSQCQHISIRGLMAIPPLGLAKSEILALFHQTYALAEQIKRQNLPRLQLDQLSLGMSDDYELAIQAGATMIRPGRILFTK
jgi:PLP dependent protein